MSKKIAYVTGGMGGIGTAMCQRLHKDGFKVIAGCGPSRDFNKWLGEQKALGYTFYASVGNVADWDSTVQAFGKALSVNARGAVMLTDADWYCQPRPNGPKDSRRALLRPHAASWSRVQALAALICGELLRRGPIFSVSAVTVSMTLELENPSWRIFASAA